ncbi:MAG TPA: hypothetical protein PLQ36_00615 [Candidatus Gracilibacteria bacterium]|nr:hypothetical protein [Candidatus Gracilibacteria bacterium]
MDYLDYRKNYTGEDLGIKTKRIEADEIAGDIHATAGSITATELASDAVETAKIKNLAVTAGKLAADAVETAKIKDDAVTAAKLAYSVVDVSVAALATAGTATVTAGAQIIGFYPTAQDRLIESIVIADTTLTLTLVSAAAAENTFKVILL